MRADLLDVNVWVALAHEDHAHHALAKRYWENSATETIAFCRLTMLGFFRIITNGAAMSGQPFNAPEAWELYRSFLAAPNVTLVHEPARFEQRLAEMSDKKSFPSARWTDCALAAWALATGCRIVSFDKGFSQFEKIGFLLIAD